MEIHRSEHAVWLAASLLLLEPWLSPAAAQFLGPEFQINSYTTGQEDRPALAADDFGNFVVVWTRNIEAGSDVEVFGQRFDAFGLPAGGEFQVNTFTTGTQDSPSVASDGFGNFLVVWHSYAESQYGQDGSRGGVFGQRFDSAGSPLGVEFQVNTYTTNWQRNPAVAMDSLGNFVVVWESYPQDGSNMGVFGQRFDSAGGPAGNEFQVNTETVNSQDSPSVAIASAADFVVVWESVQGFGGLGIRGQRFDSVGTPLGLEFRVESFTTGYQRRPAVAADGSGNFLVVWDSQPQFGGPVGVFGQRFDAIGTPLASEVQINLNTTGSQYAPTVSADGSGNFVMVWQSDVGDGSGDGVFGRRTDSEGPPLGDQFQVNTYTTSRQVHPVVAADGLGNFIVAWSSYSQDGDGWGVFGQRVSKWLFIDGFEENNACAWSQAVGGGC